MGIKERTKHTPIQQWFRGDEMKLWFDDIRPAPPGWHWAKTVDEAKEIILTQAPIEASLDHDLGETT